MECADDAELLIECAGWAANDECISNTAYMRLTCPFSCQTWLKDNPHCIKPLDADEAILRCTPCARTFYAGKIDIHAARLIDQIRVLWR